MSMEESVQVQPFVEVTFQQSMYQTSIADGTQPCWNEKLEMEFKYHIMDDIVEPGEVAIAVLVAGGALQNIPRRISHLAMAICALHNLGDVLELEEKEHAATSKEEDDEEPDQEGLKNELREDPSPNGDYNSSVLCKMKDKILINLYDNINVPNTEVSGTFRIDTPPMLLGYTWKKIDTGSCEQFYEFGLAESSLLTIFMTLDPQVSCLDSDDKQPPLWQLETIEDDKMLHMARAFQKEIHTLYPKRRIIVSIIDTECRVGIVTRYIRPLCPPQELLETFPENLEATFNLIARFVSLIPYLPDSLGFSDSCSIWLTSQQFLNLILGGKEDHAILLCNYLLYMKENAFVLLGTSILEGLGAYVITQEKLNTMIWNPETGECYDQYNAFCPIQSADCLINNENIWVNIQKNNLPMSLNFDVTKDYNWKPFFSKSSQPHVLSSVQPQELIYYSTERSMVDKLQNRIEWALKSKIMDWRAQHPTRWNRYCTGVFQRFLPVLEQNLGHSVSEEQSTALESLLKDFKVSGFPLQMRYSKLEAIFDKVYSTGVHNIEIPNVEFAVAVYIYPYPNNVLSVWIYVASLVHDTYK
ncbi:protein CC2D2B-like [Scyliorhinus torazame]|uniref:protein CC2D2B-like n=1 Tax=Scyliorhinus torazame TaxID=75743 RepID=UPI003B5CF450